GHGGLVEPEREVVALGLGHLEADGGLAGGGGDLDGIEHLGNEDVSGGQRVLELVAVLGPAHLAEGGVEGGGARDGRGRAEGGDVQAAWAQLDHGGGADDGKGHSRFLL